MQELRRHQRLKIPLRVEIQHETTGTMELEARDMSDGGVFLLLDECFQPALGDLLRVRSIGLGIDGNESGPLLLMRIVRKTPTGIGLSLEPFLLQGESIQAENYTEPSRSVMQRLFILGPEQTVLIHEEDQQRSLPGRPLSSDETWQQGLQQCLAQLREASVAIADAIEYSSDQCYPATEGTDAQLEMLIPCQLAAGSAAASLPQHYRWLPLSQVDSLAHRIDAAVVTRISDQG